MVFGLPSCYVASWPRRSLPLELVAFDRLNIKHYAIYRTVRSGLLGWSAWLWLGELREEEDGL